MALRVLSSAPGSPSSLPHMVPIVCSDDIAEDNEHPSTFVESLTANEVVIAKRAIDMPFAKAAATSVQWLSGNAESPQPRAMSLRD